MEQSEQVQPTEDMALLSHQHPRPSLTSDEAALAYPDDEPFQTDPSIYANPDDEELWKKFEVHRRSAEYYLRLYHETMDRIDHDISDHSNEPPEPLHVTQQGANSNGDMVKLKIYTDTLLRDLMVMEDIAIQTQHIHNSTEPPLIKPAPAFM